MNGHSTTIQAERRVGLESGFLLVAELTGVPAAVAGGLGHPARNRTLLLRAFGDRLAPGLRIESVEGNRLVATARDGEIPKAAVLFDLIDAAYGAFRSARLEMLDSRKCTCDGCLGTAGVRIHLVAHHGRWTREGDACGGDDVTQTLALLTAPELEPGSRLLVTDAALRRTEIDPRAAGMRTMDVVDGGSPGAVADLELAWQRDGRSVGLDPADVVATVELVLPVPPPVAWDWLTAPDKRTLWEEVDSIECAPRPDGRAGVGTRYRSLHGKRVDEVREVLDWKPFRSWTWDLSSRQAHVRATVELSATPTGTRVVNTIGVPAGRPPLAKLRTRRAIRSRVAPLRTEALERLRTLLEVERSFGSGGS